MSILYIAEAGAKISARAGRFEINVPDGSNRSIPIESVQGITLLTKVNLTTDCIQTCLAHGIPVAFCSRKGKYFGRLVSTGHINTALQRKQSELYRKPFALALSKRIILAKCRNQMTVLRRYAKSRQIPIGDLEIPMKDMERKIAETIEHNELMGCEGYHAKLYFQGLARCIEDKFRFKGRNRRPPKDPFNAMISLGYTIMMNEIYCEIEAHGMNPYFGFLHKDAEKHPTLTSDLLEEWRAVLIDSMAMSLINGHEIHEEHFAHSVDKTACYLTKDGAAIYLKKLEKKLQASANYLHYTDAKINFRRAISLQTARLAEAIQEEDETIYEPIRIR